MGQCSTSWDLVAKSNNTLNLPDLLTPVIMHIKQYPTSSIYFLLLQVLHCKKAKANIPQKERKVLDFCSSPSYPHPDFQFVTTKGKCRDECLLK